MQRTEPRLILETHTDPLLTGCRLARSCVTILMAANRPIHSAYTRSGNESIIVIVAKLVLKNKTTNATAAGSPTDKPAGDIVSLIAWHGI